MNRDERIGGSAEKGVLCDKPPSATKDRDEERGEGIVEDNLAGMFKLLPPDEKMSPEAKSRVLARIHRTLESAPDKRGFSRKRPVAAFFKYALPPAAAAAIILALSWLGSPSPSTALAEVLGHVRVAKTVSYWKVDRISSGIRASYNRVRGTESARRDEYWPTPEGSVDFYRSFPDTSLLGLVVLMQRKTGAESQFFIDIRDKRVGAIVTDVFGLPNISFEDALGARHQIETAVSLAGKSGRLLEKKRLGPYDVTGYEIRFKDVAIPEEWMVFDPTYPPDAVSVWVDDVLKLPRQIDFRYEKSEMSRSLRNFRWDEEMPDELFSTARYSHFKHQEEKRFRAQLNGLKLKRGVSLTLSNGEGRAVGSVDDIEACFAMAGCGSRTDKPAGDLYLYIRLNPSAYGRFVSAGSRGTCALGDQKLDCHAFPLLNGESGSRRMAIRVDALGLSADEFQRQYLEER